MSENWDNNEKCFCCGGKGCPSCIPSTPTVKPTYEQLQAELASRDRQIIEMTKLGMSDSTKIVELEAEVAKITAERQRLWELFCAYKMSQQRINDNWQEANQRLEAEVERLKNTKMLLTYISRWLKPQSNRQRKERRDDTTQKSGLCL